jgi:phenylpropionate dioxygenase-like ring-hydroxylating dioxygenase large terminal subunit
MIGWSPEVPTGTVKPMKYFGQDLVAYRDDAGELHVLDAHCPHLGAHLGHRGKVNGDCVECPYHGWGYGPDGVNRYIPYEDRPNVSKRLKSWPVAERHECMFIWHDPFDGQPRWELPSVFELATHVGSSDPADYYRAYPELSDCYRGEPVHPQITLENAPDSVHFKYVHAAGSDPVLLHWEAVENRYETIAGWPNPATNSPDDIVLKIHSYAVGVGASLAIFEGNEHYRLIFFTTPVDDETSDMFYSIWWPRVAGVDSPAPPQQVIDRVRRKYLQTLQDDLEIWRYQIYIETPAFAQQDARPYGALRKWARQFYEIEPAQ